MLCSRHKLRLAMIHTAVCSKPCVNIAMHACAHCHICTLPCLHIAVCAHCCARTLSCVRALNATYGHCILTLWTPGDGIPTFRKLSYAAGLRYTVQTARYRTRRQTVYPRHGV